MKVLSLNARNWNRDTDKDSPYYWRVRSRAMNRMLNYLSPDIICFQEMLCPMTDYIPSGYKRVGVSVSHHIYIRKNLTASDIKFHIHWQSCVVNGVTIACVHGHWDADKTDKLCHDLIQLPGSKRVAMGDFNVSIDSLISRGLPKSARQLLDVKVMSTFAHFEKENRGEIDHAILWGLTPKSFKVITYGYGCERISDHFPILLEI